MSVANGPLEPAGETAKGAIMLYPLDRGLFVENGPTLLAQRDRQARAAGQAHRLLAAARPAPDTVRDDIRLSAAA